MKITEQRLNKLADKISRIGDRETPISDAVFLRIAEHTFKRLQSGDSDLLNKPETRQATLTLLNAYIKKGDKPAIIEEIKLYLKGYENNGAKT